MAYAMNLGAVAVEADDTQRPFTEEELWEEVTALEGC